MPNTYGNPFTYLAFDLMTMHELDPLPYTGVTFSRQINTPGSWSGSLLISDSRVQKLRYLESNKTGRVALFVDYLGILIWGGIIWTRRYKKSTKTLQIAAAEFGSLFQQRLQAKDYTTYWEPGGAVGETNPLEIIKKLMEDALEYEHTVTGEYSVAGYAAGKINLTLNYSEGYAEAPKVSVSYPGTQLQTLDSITSTLSQMGYGQGFDYSYDVAYKPESKEPEVILNLWFPRQGKRAAQTGIVILDKNCLDVSYDEDSTQQSVEVHEVGSGSGGIQPDSLLAGNVIAAGYPLLESMTSHTQINNQSILANVTLGEAAVRAWPVVTPTLELPIPLPNPETGLLDPSKLTFGQFDLGDNLIYRVDPIAGGGENTDPRWPNGLNFEWRLPGWTATINDKGVPMLLLDLGISPLEEIPGPMPPLE